MFATLAEIEAHFKDVPKSHPNYDKIQVELAELSVLGMGGLCSSGGFDAKKLKMLPRSRGAAKCCPGAEVRQGAAHTGSCCLAGFSTANNQQPLLRDNTGFHPVIER